MALLPQKERQARMRRAVRDYPRHATFKTREAVFFKALPLRRAIDLAARARTSAGGKHPHQRRLVNAALRDFAGLLGASHPAWG